MKIAKYACVGGVAAVTDILIFVVFAKFLALNYLVVGAVGFIIATGVNYALSIRYVFVSGKRFSKRTELIAVYAISGVGLVIHEVILWLFVSSMQTELVTSKLIATGSVFFWNYYARHHFVFAKGVSC